VVEGTPTRLLLEQTTAVSPDRLGDSVGRLGAAELGAMDSALAVVFGL
jgi:mRNA interferase MazF